MSYLAIENYGVIGNMRTAALVGTNGSVDWLCFPHFDSPSVFAAVLDEKKGGSFQIAPALSEFNTKQFYWPDTNVLVTWFLTPDGVAELRDYMPVGGRDEEHTNVLIRRVKMLRGTMKFRLRCSPALNYGRDSHTLRVNKRGAVFEGETFALGLESSVVLGTRRNSAVSEFLLEEEGVATFVLRPLEKGELLDKPIADEPERRLFVATVDYWQSWLSKCTYRGRWREMVRRSALTLKLLTFEPTGAIVASPTCSLPEEIGGMRNWDYRYTWVRDAAFTIYGLMRIGFVEEAARFMDWLDARCHEARSDGTLQIMYSIEGKHQLTEELLSHFEGYRGSGPVRIGNAAHNQVQLDIYGELLDSAYLFNKYGPPISYDLWKHLRRMINWVCDNWKEADEGIWEVRGEKQHFVYSKVMCWVALDRGLRLASKRSFPADWNRWQSTRDEMYEDIMSRGWNSEKRTFVQSYGSTSLDASVLIMPLVFFLSPADPRMLKTLDAILKPPSKGGLVSNGLVYRYNTDHGTDGLTGSEGAFNMCTFWLVEALTRAGQYDPTRLIDARIMFERMLGYANHLGLYAEETGHGGESLGNFPQAFTHLGLISAAVNLDRALGG